GRRRRGRRGAPHPVAPPAQGGGDREAPRRRHLLPAAGRLARRLRRVSSALNLGLEGRVALVGGASRGLGRAVAEELAAEGASVALAARKSDSLDAAAEALGALALAADLSVDGEPTRVVEGCAEPFGRLA